MMFSVKPVKKFHLSKDQYESVVHLLAIQTGYSDKLVRGAYGRTGAQLVSMLRDTINGNDCIYHKYGLSILRDISSVHHIRGRSITGDYPRYCVSLCVLCHDRVTRNMGDPDNVELQAIVDSMAVDYPRLLKLDYDSHVEEIQFYIDEYKDWKWKP